MNHKSKKYNKPEDEPQMVSEPLGGVAYAVQQQDMRPQVVMELSNVHKFRSTPEHLLERKKEFLRTHLHPSTAEYLETVDWMEDKPFPVYEDKDDESWIDEAEAAGDSNIVDEARINQDRAAWCLASKDKDTLLV